MAATSRERPRARGAPSSSADPELAERAVDAADGGEAVAAVSLPALAAAGVRAVSHSGTVRGTARLARESARILRGSSTVAPERGDWRFRDPTWRDNAGYRRLMQFYLAWAEEVVQVVESADLDWRQAERARFLATLITTTLAPTNTLPGNPEALKRVLESGGRSLARGARNAISDIRHNGGMPSTVKSSAFTLGENLAATKGAVVYRDEVCEVIQYAPATPHVRARPVVMVAPQINKYYFMDLAPGRSFIEHAVSRGLQFFAISWRNPGTGQRAWDLDVYAAAVLRVIDVAREITRSDDVNLLSLCAGGILTTTVLSHLAAEGDERVRAASFGVTLLDFEVPAPIGTFDAPPVISTGWCSSRSRCAESSPSPRRPTVRRSGCWRGAALRMSDPHCLLSAGAGRGGDQPPGWPARRAAGDQRRHRPGRDQDVRISPPGATIPVPANGG